MKNYKVLIVMGSSSDWPVMKKAQEQLKNFGIDCDAKVSSAHRAPAETAELAATAHEHYQVIIAGAGGAAHLPGVMSGHSILPVIGVPVESKLAGGLDSLLSIVQMPKGIPVATVGVNRADNAGILAVEILGVSDPEIRKKLQAFKADQKKKNLDSSKELV